MSVAKLPECIGCGSEHTLASIHGWLCERCWHVKHAAEMEKRALRLFAKVSVFRKS